MRKQGLRAVPLLMLAVCSVAHAAVTRSVSPVGDRRSSSTIQQSIAYAGYSSSSAQIKHVRPTGSDSSGTGSSASPWRTIARAVRSLSPGDTLYIHAGTYPDTEVDLAAEGAANGTSTAPIVLMRAPGEAKPVLKATGVQPLFTLNRAYWVLSGLELDGRFLHESAVSIPTEGHHITLRDSLLRDAGKDALIIRGNNIYIYNNEIRNTFEAVDGSSPGSSCTSHATCTGTSFCKPRYNSNNELVTNCQPRDDGHAIGINSNAHSVLIRDNIIHDSTGDGLQCSGPWQGYNPGNRPYDITLEDNHIYTSTENLGVTENAVDIKDCDYVTLRRETYEGFRPTTGSNGNNSGGGAIVFHIEANRVLLEDSDVSDACNALGTGNNSGDTVGNVVIRRNRFHDLRKTDGCDSDEGNALVFEKLSHADIYHNTFASIPGRVLRMGQTWPVSDVDFWNNIVATSSSSARWMEVLSVNVSGFDAAANLYWNTGSATSQFYCNGTQMDLGDWRTSACDEVTDFETQSVSGMNPGFVDAAEDDYQLQSTSPALDEALDNTSATFCGAGPDIGAFERCQSGEPTVYWHAGNFRYLLRTSGDLATFVDQLEHPNASGFGKVSTNREADFTAFLDALFAAITASRNDGNTGDWCAVRAAAGAAGYEVQRFYDTVTGRWFVYGYDTTGFGHSSFFINPYAKRNLVIEVPHEPSELGTGLQGARLFTSLAARALIINKEHRCSDPDATTCSGTTSTCGGYYRESDVAHHDRNTFHMLHKRFNDMDSATRFVQLHGMTGSSTDMAVIADSSTSDFDAQSVSVAFANALDGYVPSASAVDSCQEYVGDPPSDFCATTNLQGRYSNDPTLNVCTAYTPNTTNRFLSIEQALSLRDDDEGDGYSWGDVRDALKATWPQCDMNNGATDCTVGPRQTWYTDWTCL